MSCFTAADGPEVPLLGGNANQGRVVRVGDTVRRPMRATSPATRALLDHLHEVGFDGAPRYLGTDSGGREVVSFVEGQAVTPPYPDWALTREALVSVAQLLRRFHDAVEGFDAADHSWPRAVPADYRDGLVTHNDPNLGNVVFRDGRAVALIDFDLASPGSRLWEVAAAARLWAPLRAPVDVTDRRRGQVLERLRTFVEGYGLDHEQRHLVPAAVVAHHDWLYRIVEDAAAEGHEAFSRYWRDGAAARAARARAWCLDAEGQIRDAAG